MADLGVSIYLFLLLHNVQQCAACANVHLTKLIGLRPSRVLQAPHPWQSSVWLDLVVVPQISCVLEMAEALEVLLPALVHALTGAATHALWEALQNLSLALQAETRSSLTELEASISREGSKAPGDSCLDSCPRICGG